MFRVKPIYIYYLIAAGLGLAVAFSNCAPNGFSTSLSQDSTQAPIEQDSNQPDLPRDYGDPGVGSGLWIPPGTSNRIVADLSTPDSKRMVSFVPGCLNGLTWELGFTGCALATSYSGAIAGANTSTTVSFGSGRQVLLRIRPKPGAGAKLGHLSVASGKLNNTDGINVKVNLRIWLSADPSATYESVPAACKVNLNTIPIVSTGPGHCPISDKISVYYFGMAYDEATSSTLQVNANWSDFY